MPNSLAHNSPPKNALWEQVLKYQHAVMVVLNTSH